MVQPRATKDYIKFVKPNRSHRAAELTFVYTTSEPTNYLSNTKEMIILVAK